MDATRIGVVGLNFGRHHVRTLANMEQADVVAVADRHPDVPGGLEAYAAGYGARAYRDGVEMLANEDLDAVSLCTSPRTCADLIAAAVYASARLATTRYPLIRKPNPIRLRGLRRRSRWRRRPGVPTL